MQVNTYFSWRWLLLVLGAALLTALSACGNAGPAAMAEPQTATAQAESVQCGRGLNRIVRVGGHEDGFDVRDAEPARIRPARLPNAYLETISQAQSGPVLLRDYDEGGSDKVLIDHFDVPRGIVSGALVIRTRATAGSNNDSGRLGNLDENAFPDGFNRTEGYGFAIARTPPAPDVISLDDNSSIATIPFGALTENPRARLKGSFLDFLSRPDRPDAIDFEVSDDTAVDVAILILCQQPQIAMGTSFAEFRSKIAATDVSFLSCFQDKTQAPCNPFQGDRLCSAKLPLACYKDGDHVPTGLAKAGLTDGYGAGGEVRTTMPVAATSLATVGAANRLCMGTFGQGWRVLEYHDGAGGAIATYSAIAPKTRVWIDVRDQRYGNCWDRDKDR